MRPTDDLPPTGTVLYRGGSIYSPADPFATAMVVADGVVGWLGSEEAAATQVAGVDRVVDLGGALVTPAFVDGHAHTTDTGIALLGVDLAGARSLAEVLQAVEAASRASRGRPVLGAGWDETTWPEGRPPTRAELDRASHGGSVYLARVDVHSAVVSSALAASLDLARYDGWDDSGRVEREAHAVVRDATRSALDPATREEYQLAALRRFAAQGVLTVHEMSAPHIAPLGDLVGLVALTGRDDLPDVVPYRGERAESQEQAEALVAALREAGVPVRGLAGDLNVDGSIGSRTAAFTEPYADDPLVAAPHGHDHRGYLYLQPEQVAAHLVACTLAGVQGGFHVIGDAGVAATVEGLRLAAAEVGADALRRSRHRLEHVEGADAASAAVLADLAVAASMQPAFDALWGGGESLYAQRLGPDRGPTLNPIGSMAAAGVVLAFGSDSPVTAVDPWGTIRAAVFHQVPEQRISARAAFNAHTRGAHRAALVDGAGALVPGAEATFAVWEAGELVVQAADARVSAWSTDERSGTPGLPDLTPGAPLPACRESVLRGRTVFER
ncbi:amidohydrolase [Angustibacter speluncae]